jgi:DNA polymerase-3 subunit beta
VATDGHRLALATELLETREHTPIQVIIPRKAVIELTRMLDNSDNEVELFVDNTHIKIVISNTLAISSKLIDGKFPDYQGVLPANPDKKVSIDTASLKTALSQSAILSNEKYRGVRLTLEPGKMLVSSRNPIQEESEIECEVDYTGEELEIGFNVTYLQDALNAITTGEVQISFSNANSSCLIQPKGIDTIKYVVMPMRL